ncbi:hypothetical protein [Ralstonia pseudosolanacearum]|uniref:hypothetical protein n=1 Tax=Ralstonia pseudosolanacearum TaxID=1310165 RepID=UPI001FFA946D|nr:hypothetical protein [Ralstonia pseudosolanacearum]
MQVVDHEPYLWFLFEQDGELYLDANCNHSFIGYTFMMRLTSNEVRRYRRQGRNYINWLAQDIQNSAPILITSNSSYKHRKASPEEEAQANAAVSAWQAAQVRGKGV